MSERPTPTRPLPLPDGFNAEFYRHCREGRLAFQRCDDCGAWRHLPRYMCARCGSERSSWQASSGRGKIFSWTITHQAMHPAFAHEVPYVIAVVELEEGVRLVSRLRGIAPKDVRLDLPVEVELEPVSDDIALPYFRPRRG